MGDIHLASRHGEPACRSREHIPRLTSDVRLVDCAACRLTSWFNSRLRWWFKRAVVHG